MEHVQEVLTGSVPYTVTIALVLFIAMAISMRGLSGRTLTKSEWEYYKDRYTTHKDEIVQEEKGAVDLATSALRSAIILNGASAGAALAFIGRIWTDPSSRLIVDLLIEVFSVLVTATLFAVVANGFGYLRMYFGSAGWHYWKFKSEDHKYIKMSGNICQSIAFFLVIESYVLFGMAMNDAVFVMSLPRNG